MNIFKKLKLYSDWKKILKKNKVDLEANFNLRFDNAYRLYTIINVPMDMFGEPYNLRKTDIDKISENYIREYIRAASDYLDSIGLSELYDFYEPIQKKDKYSYLLILGFKPMNTVDYNKFIYLRLLPISAVLGLISLILGMIKIFF